LAEDSVSHGREQPELIARKIRPQINYLPAHDMRLRRDLEVFFDAATQNTMVALVHGSIVNTLKPEPKRSKLGQFRPETKMRGWWIGCAAVACLVGSFVLSELWSMIPGAILAVSALVLGKLGLDSKGRILALVGLIGGVLLIGVYLTVLIIGKENIGILLR